MRTPKVAGATSGESFRAQSWEIKGYILLPVDWVSFAIASPGKLLSLVPVLDGVRGKRGDEARRVAKKGLVSYRKVKK